MAEKEKLEFRGVKGGWLENFWYYHKWKVIIAAFFSVVLIICIVQVAERESPDSYIMYAGPGLLTANEETTLRGALRSVVKDYNGDGETGMTLVNVTYLTDEQIAAREKEALEESRQIFIDRAANQQRLKSFDAEIFAGESVICMLDPWLYGRVRSAGGFMPMSEIFTKEELADTGVEFYDACGVYLSSTRFAKYHTVFGELPEDTILCIRRISTMSVFKGREKYEHIHADHVDVLRSIVLFEYPEGYIPDTAADTVTDTAADTASDTVLSN